ncbi:MAG: succinylglutamate desuccinylase/aspartoacylase family protein [Balneolaceae bacterium]
MPDFISIKDQQIGLGEDKKIYLSIARLPTYTNIDLPVHVYRSKIDGPVLLLTGGLHGDEINGIEIIRSLMDSKQIIPQRGTVIALPIVNVYGFILNVRGVPDGKDINRSFPGAKGGSLARLLAYTLMNDIIPNIDCGIDFHTGGASRANFPQIRCSFNLQNAKQLAAAFSAPITLHSTLISKSFRSAAHKKGKPILVYETGESLRFDDDGIEKGINGTLRLMKHLKMIDEAPISSGTKMFKKSSWLRAKNAGLFSPSFDLGAEIRNKETLGYINDPFGGRKTKMVFSQNGVIIGQNNNPIVHKGDALIHIAHN